MGITGTTNRILQLAACGLRVALQKTACRRSKTGASPVRDDPRHVKPVKKSQLVLSCISSHLVHPIVIARSSCGATQRPQGSGQHELVAHSRATAADTPTFSGSRPLFSRLRKALPADDARQIVTCGFRTLMLDEMPSKPTKKGRSSPP